MPNIRYVLTQTILPEALIHESFDSDTSVIETRDSETLITDHMALVGYIVREVAGRLPRHVDLGDLHSAGLLGLVQAAHAFDASRGVPFRRYANTRVRGAVIDELRSRSWASRSTRQTGRRRDEAVEALAASLGRMPSQSEIADYLGVTVAELDTVNSDLHRTVVLSIDAAPSPESLEGSMQHTAATPEDELLRSEESRYLHAAVDSLPERMRIVVSMYYLQGKPMADIAAVLDVSESRVSQMRAQALGMLRDGVNSQLDPERVDESEKPGGCVDRRRASYLAAVAQAGDVRRHMATRNRVPQQARPSHIQSA